MPLTSAQKQAAYRARKAQASTPTAPTIEASPEDTAKVEQMSRAAGVPRNYPLSVWKRAAESFFQGEGKTQDKVKALRSLCASDKEWRLKVSKWVRADQSEAVKKYVNAQGWELAEGTAQPVSLVDRMVACLEAGKRLEDNFTAEELDSPAPRDPAIDDLWERSQKASPKASSRKCGEPGCSKDFITDYFGEKRCNEHAIPMPMGPPLPSRFAAVSNPADYSTVPASPLPTVPDPTGRIAVLQALRHAQAAYPASDGRPMFGPVGANSVFVNCR